MPPTVRTLDQLVADSNSIYQPQQQAIQDRITTANNNNIAQEQGLQAAQTNAFNDITQAAASRGALFSGFTPDQQARYTSEKYLPALANLRAANQQTIQGLNDNSLALSTDQLTKAQATREGDLTKLYDYNKTIQEQQFQTEQANIAYQREMAKMRAEQSFQSSQNAQQTPTQQQAVLSAFAAGIDPKTGKTKTGLAEALIAQVVAQYPGTTQQQAANLVYGLRKQYFKE